METDYEPKVIGVCDGMSQLESGPDFYKENLWFLSIFLSSKEEFKTKWIQRAEIKYYHKLNNILFRKESIATDIMQFGIRGYIVSEKVRGILSDCILPNHQFFDITIDNNKSGIQYWWLVYDLEKGTNTINFNKCIFDFRRHNKYSDKKINTYTEYMSTFLESGIAPKATKLVFNRNFNTSYDIWGTQFLSLTESYISQHLHETFLKNQVTGFRAFKPKCELVFE
ncbi:hypothetical protein [Hymenobacter yonginensis]|uniref:DUF3800 domain-containing protein n=1 Tax=Hymenobacter yonginensis TaxID=748197 RepID=A0ABY7PTR4_9BACT|nr:hypothetical protein [Hymenobacter yonginensis]WBO86289.1 hypothetical protein O9Z63_08500 [Hymenobacter yonginensis]